MKGVSKPIEEASVVNTPILLCKFTLFTITLKEIIIAFYIRVFEYTVLCQAAMVKD